MKRDRAWVLGVAFSIVCACGYYDSTLLEPGSQTDAGVDGAQGCESARPPQRPSNTASGGTIEFIVAVQSIDFKEQGDYKSIGFDLDNTCTCQGDGPSCALPSGAVEQDQCDGLGGRDNSAAGLIAASAMLGLTSGDFNKDIKNGEWSLLLRVRGYNGQPDDDQVSVAWLVTNMRSAPPVWDGTDAWPIKTTCLNPDGQGKGDLENPKIIDNNAYVSQGRLVASIKGGAPLDVNPQFSIVVTSSFIVAKVTPSGSSYALEEGVLSGLWIPRDLLKQLAGAKVGGVPLCTDNPLYSDIKKQVCKARDISANSSIPSQPCDAITMAFAFVSKPALVGAVVTPTPPEVPCTPATDPANDDCK
ncbi:MAG: hypothetical protein HY898_06650 [Deltaproteobacteria bacterium]|nr:hypothetical protein [Deltaproteobacteria bacterium]